MVAATGVGAADLVATLIAGQKFGYTLLWCVVVGCIMKIVLVEGAGRYSLATGSTIFEGWRTLGAWTTWYFAPYIVIWGFVYGAAAMAGTGLALAGALRRPVHDWWGILSGLLGLVLVWTGRYSVFEKVLAALVGIMFVTMVGAALLTLPNLGELLTGLAPRIPDGGLVNTLALAGGVGGTITLAAYGYWLREKGWDTPRYMRVMRIDNRVAYVVTGIFVLATLVVGAELLYSTSVAIESGDRACVDLGVVLQDRYGEWAGKLFLLGFWAAAMSSLVGVWNGVSLMFADFVTNVPRASERRRPRRRQVVPRLPPVADVPADGDAVPRQAGLADPRLRRARRVLHAVPRHHPAVAAQHRPHARRVAQQAALQRADGDHRAGVHRPVRQRGPQGGRRSMTLMPRWGA